MVKLSQHFSDDEFKCSCCGKKVTMSQLLINRLEQMFDLMNAKAIIINSGYRCERNPWGSVTDTHRKGMAADIKIIRQNNTFYRSEEIAEAAERVGFKGIGMMLPDACHVDTRGDEPYTYSWWHGNETTGIDYMQGHTFIKGTVFEGEKQTPGVQQEETNSSNKINNDEVKAPSSVILELTGKRYEYTLKGIVGDN